MANARLILAVPVAGLALVTLVAGISDLGDAKHAIDGISSVKANEPIGKEASASASWEMGGNSSREAPVMPTRPAPDAEPEKIAALPESQSQETSATPSAAEQVIVKPVAEPSIPNAEPEVASIPVTGEGRNLEVADRPATMKEARKAIRARDFAGAAAVLEQLGEDPEAQYLLATLYRKGDGVPRDDARAFKHMSAAAEAGHLEAQFSLARMFISGRGAEANREKAQLWLSRAAEAGHVGATEALVALMTQGLPAPADIPAVETTKPRVAASDIGERLGKSPLIEAAERGEVRALKRILDSGSEADVRDADGRTPLMVAAAGGHVEAIRLLLDHGAQPAASDAEGRTPVMHAAKNGHMDAVSILAPSQDQLDIRDAAGLTASELAFSSGHCALGVTLFTGTVSLDTEAAILESCGSDDLASLADAGLRFHADDGRGRSPVWYAAQNGNLSAVSFLLDAGYSADDEKVPPLLVAINGAHSDIAVLLLDHGAAIESETRSGNTALLIAATRGLAEVSAVLLERGADIDHRNADGYSALMLAAKFGREDIVRLLIDHGADKDLRNSKREQASQIAEAAGFAEIAMLLN